MIHLAELSDVSDVVDLAQAFYEEVSPPWDWDRPTIERTVARCILNDDGLALLAKQDGTTVGFLLARSAPADLHAGLEAHELMMFVEVNHRGRIGVDLIKAFIGWGERIGAALTVLQDISGRAGLVYRKHGFRYTAGVWAR